MRNSALPKTHLLRCNFTDDKLINNGGQRDARVQSGVTMRVGSARLRCGGVRPLIGGLVRRRRSPPPPFRRLFPAQFRFEQILEVARQRQHGRPHLLTVRFEST